jgi:hypothetical protein
MAISPWKFYPNRVDAFRTPSLRYRNDKLALLRASWKRFFGYAGAQLLFLLVNC